MDETSFDLVFSEIDNSNFLNNFPHETNIKSYILKNDDFENKVLQKIIIRIGEVLKSINTNNLPFNKFCEKNEEFLFKVKITKNLLNIEFWIQSLDEKNFKWKFDMYTFHQISVKNTLRYFNKSFELDITDFIKIFGYYPNDLWPILTVKQKIICNYILFNSIKLGKILKEIQTDKNNELILNIVRITPYNFKKFNFVYYNNKKISTVIFELLFYNRLNYFIRIQITDHFTLDTITNIMLGYYENIVKEQNIPYYLLDFETFKSAIKEVEKNFDLMELAINDKSLMKQSIIQYIEEIILKKGNSHLNLFSNAEIFFDILRSKKFK